MKPTGKVELLTLGLFLCNFWHFFPRVLVEFFFKCVSDNKNIKFMFAGIKMFWPTQSHLILDQAVVRGRLKLKLIFTNWNIITFTRKCTPKQIDSKHLEHFNCINISEVCHIAWNKKQTARKGKNNLRHRDIYVCMVVNTVEVWALCSLF